MNQFTTRLAVALSAFTVGVAAATLYVFDRIRTPPPPEVSEARAVDDACFPGLSRKAGAASRPSLFFPPGAFDPDPAREQFTVEWYSKHLTAMEEPSLASPGSGQEGYRFLWLPSFQNSVAVRVWRSGNEALMSVKRLDGAGGYEPGELVVNRVRPLSAREWDEFERLLGLACYWKLPTKARGGLDGSRWILEGAKEGRYHVVDRWSPRGGSYREACLYLLKISEVSGEVPAENFY